MNKLSFSLLVTCASLVSNTLTTAAETTSYGNFEPGSEFTLTVSKRITARTRGTDVAKNVAVPSGLPDFRVGRKVHFTIGKHGQLTGPGFSIVFRKSKSGANIYANKSVSKGAAATVVKFNGEPMGALLTFYKTGFYSWKPVSYSATYVLE